MVVIIKEMMNEEQEGVQAARKDIQGLVCTVGPLLDRGKTCKLPSRSGHAQEGIRWTALYHSNAQ